MGSPRSMRTAIWVLFGALVFVGFAVLHARVVNVSYLRHDQDAYLAMAIEQADSGFTALGNRRQMPLYPTLLALFHRHGEPVEAFFARAKLVNVGLAALVSLALWLGLPRLLPRREARNLALLGIFFVLAFRAGYVQVEVLSYAAIFGLFLLLIRLWSRPSLPLELLAGGVGALAYLTKGTGLVGLYAFFGLLVLRELVRALRLRQPREAARRLAHAAVIPLVFAAGVFPYARNNKALYGSYLFDMSTRYVMWCDSWEHFSALNAKYGLWTGWRALPEEQLPSMRNYLATHGPGQILTREALGLGEVLGNCLLSHGYAPFVVALLAFAVLLVVRNPPLRARVFRLRDPDWAGWLVLPYLAVHLLLLGFYGPITAGDRFSLAMLLPAAYAVMRAFATAARPEDKVTLGALSLDWAGFQEVFFAALVVELVAYWPAAMATHYSGG